MKNYLFLILCLCFVACDDDDVMEIDTAIHITGVTLTDIAGVVLSDDPTDWQLTDEWTAAEQALFPTPTLESCTPKNMETAFPIYPNANNGVFYFGLANLQNSTAYIRIVDENLTLISVADSLVLENEFSDFAFDLSGMNIQNTVRMYYQIIPADESCTYRGHGDIVIEP